MLSIRRNRSMFILNYATYTGYKVMTTCNVGSLVAVIKQFQRTLIISTALHRDVKIETLSFIKAIHCV